MEGQTYYTGFNKEYIRFYIPMQKDGVLEIGGVYPVLAKKAMEESLLGELFSE